MANVRIDGLTDLGTRVKNMGKDARGAAGQALRKGAEIIREEAHVRAPRSKNGHPATYGRTAKHLADQHNPVAYVKSLDFAPEYVSCEYHTAYSNPGFIAKLQAMGVKVALWTVDTEKAVRSLLPLGPDCIVTNRPDRVREWVEENQ